MDIQNETYLAKYVLLGNENVGKSTIAQQFIFNKISNNSSTLGASFYTKNINIPNTNHMINISLWDTAGQERYRSLVPIYYKGSNVFIIVFDINDIKSWKDVLFWTNQIKNNSNSNDGDYIIVIIGNKKDKLNVISSEEIENTEKICGIKVFLISAISETAIEDINMIFNYISSTLYEKISIKSNKKEKKIITLDNISSNGDKNILKYFKNLCIL